MARQIWDDHAPLPRRPQDDGNERDADASAREPNRAARQEPEADADPDAELVASRRLGQG